MYGTNATGDKDDPISEYERRFEKVIKKARHAAGDASCVYIGPSDRPIKVGSYDVIPDLAKRLKGKGGIMTSKDFPRTRKNKKGRRASAPKVKKIDRTLFFQLDRVRPKSSMCSVDLDKTWLCLLGSNAMMGGDLSMLKWVHASPDLARGITFTTTVRATNAPPTSFGMY